MVGSDMCWIGRKPENAHTTAEERKFVLLAELHAPGYRMKKPQQPAPGVYTTRILELCGETSNTNTTKPREFAVVFGEFLNAHIQKGVVFFNPLTVLSYSMELQQYGLSPIEFNRAIENSNHAQLFDWEDKIQFHIKQLIGVSRSQDVYDESTNDGYIDWREGGKSVDEDTVYLYQREFKYSLKVIDVISTERKRRLENAYTFILVCEKLVCKKLECLPIELVKFIVGFVKDG